jgi:hypothetical protein
MISCGLLLVVHCLDKPHPTSRSIREEPQRSKEPEAREIKKKRRKV